MRKPSEEHRVNPASHENPSRLSQAERFLKDGDKVKATIMFRGREIQHSDLAEVLLKRMAEDLKEIDRKSVV